MQDSLYNSNRVSKTVKNTHTKSTNIKLFRKYLIKFCKKTFFQDLLQLQVLNLSNIIEGNLKEMFVTGHFLIKQHLLIK